MPPVVELKVKCAMLIGELKCTSIQLRTIAERIKTNAVNITLFFTSIQQCLIYLGLPAGMAEVPEPKGPSVAGRGLSESSRDRRAGFAERVVDGTAEVVSRRAARTGASITGAMRDTGIFMAFTDPADRCIPASFSKARHQFDVMQTMIQRRKSPLVSLAVRDNCMLARQVPGLHVPAQTSIASISR